MVILSDLIQRDQFLQEVLRESIRKSVFWNSGVIRPDSDLTKAIAAKTGTKVSFDYFLDLQDLESRISDDSNTLAGTDGIDTNTDVAVINYRNRSWGAKNITAGLSTTGDPLQAIASRVGAYWSRQMDFTTMSIVTGLFADNVLNDASDMVNDQSGTAVDLPMILDTIQTAGDASGSLQSMIVHSAVETSLKKQGIVDRIYDPATGTYLYSALAGVRLIVTDSVPSAGGNYTSYLVGTGSIAYGEVQPKRNIEVEYTAATGNGAGQETLWSRKEFSLHPYGFSYVGTPASTSPTNAEFEQDTSWDRTQVRKNVALAALISGI
jgi:hypothetical protein